MDRNFTLLDQTGSYLLTYLLTESGFFSELRETLSGEDLKHLPLKTIENPI